MSRIYLVRHGQAGTRKAYDSLSDVGRRQARLLGEHFLAEGIRFDAVYSGALERQQATAAEVQSVFREAGADFPEITLDTGWNEFDLDHIYRALAPRLSADDAEFRAQYEELVAEARAAEGSPEAHINRRWMPCDTTVVRAWLGQLYEYEGESWHDFRTRVIACRERMEGENIAVFTSATPIGIWTALTMEIGDHRAMHLAASVQNTACTVIRLAGEALRLHSFNTVPHLASPELRTYR